MIAIHLNVANEIMIITMGTKIPGLLLVLLVYQGKMFRLLFILDLKCQTKQKLHPDEMAHNNFFIFVATLTHHFFYFLD